MKTASRHPVLAALLRAHTIAQGFPGSSAIKTPREAVLLLFSDPMHSGCFVLADLSRREWSNLVHWLDISGMALYFLERLRQLNLLGILPSSIRARLEQNQADNTARAQGMIAESIRIQQAFQHEHVDYAILKGLSLCPESVPRIELRHQFDLDYLIAARHEQTAKSVLLSQGYRLYARSGRSLEFKRNERPAISMRDFYKNQPGRSVELHIEADGNAASSMLARAEHRTLAEMQMPVLTPVDLFIGQALHVFKDICSEFCRLSHLLEFRSHILERRDDSAFWHNLEIAVGSNIRARVGLSVATQFISEVMGSFAPHALTRWTVARLPASIQLWSKLYAKRVAFADVPGTKFYLLLQSELERIGLPARRSVSKSLIPSRLPPLVMRAAAHESMSTRLKRYSLQCRTLASRLRFHLVQGFRYAQEQRRWREQLVRLS